MDIVNASSKQFSKNIIAPYDFYDVSPCAPILIACPHSGRHYPDELFAQSGLGLDNLRESEDAYIDEICADIKEFGLLMISANYARSYIDLNRSPDVLDNQIIEGANSSTCPMTRAGFGIIPRYVGFGREIYKEKIPLSTALQRIDAIHRPYHEKVAQIIDRLKGQFGRAILLDMHSMPSSSLGNLDADIVLGDRFGSSCRTETIDFIEAKFKEHGLKTRRNHPFAGGYSTINYGKPSLGCEALQIEICRALYMNEANLEKNNGFTKIKSIIEDVISQTIKFFG